MEPTTTTGKKTLPRWAKRVLIGFGGLFGLLFLAAVLTPLFVDVDKFRPRIVEEVQNRLNGTFVLGKLHLSLWGRVRVVVDGFTIKDKNGATVVAAKDVDFLVPFWPALMGRPEVRFRLLKPELSVVKQKNGKMNVLTLVKEDAAAKKEEPAAAAGEGKPGELPGIVQRARLGVDVLEAHVVYKDEITGLTAKVDDLNFELRDASLTAPSTARVWAKLDTQMGKTLKVKGPLEARAALNPSPSAPTPLAAGKANVSFDADKLEIAAAGTFQKSASVPAHGNLSVVWGSGKIAIENGGGVFHNVELTLSGEVINVPETPTFALDGKTNSFALKAWSQLVPMLSAYELGGSASADFALRGTASAPQYRLRAAMNEVTVKAPGLAAKPTLDGEMVVVPDKVEKIAGRFRAPGTDLRLNGSVVGFEKPRIDMKLTGPSLDVDKLLGLPAPGSAKTAAKKSDSSGGSAAEVDLDPMLDPIRKNEALRGLVFNFGLDVKKVEANGATVNDFTGNFRFQNLVAQLDSLKGKTFGGTFGMAGTVDVKPKAPTYKFHMDVTNIDLKKAVESQMQSFKDTVYGQATFRIDGTGQSLTASRAKKNLDGKGSLKVANAVFQTIDVMRIMREAVGKAVQQVAAKVPNLKIPDLKGTDRASEYESITADFTISKGLFSMPNFFAKAKPNLGIDIKGTTTLGLVDQSLAANWELIDTYNVTKGRDVSVNVAGTEIPNLLVEPGKPFTLPVRIKGFASAPAPDYGAAPEALAKVAVANVGRAAENRVKQEAKAKAQDVVKQGIKKLFGR